MRFDEKGLEIGKTLMLLPGPLSISGWRGEEGNRYKTEG